MGGAKTYKDAAAFILEQSQVPMHCAEIADKAIEQKLVAPSGKTPRDTMCAQLTMDIKKGSRSRFIKTSPSHYALNPDYEPPVGSPKQKPDSRKLRNETSPKTPPAHTGKGGEHLVASRLLFLGYNVSIMAVDTGADLIATKNGRTFYIQVKTANLSGNRYRFNIRVGSFEKHASTSMFYIFVIRHGDPAAARQCEDFLILPYTKIQECIDKKLIRHILGDTLLDVSVMKEEDGFSLARKGNEVKFYMNNWSLIK